MVSSRCVLSHVVVAWRLYFSTHMRRGDTESVYFTALLGETLSFFSLNISTSTTTRARCLYSRISVRREPLTYR